jgi:glutamate-1-semialdehyde 2,1-aminomutase
MADLLRARNIPEKPSPGAHKECVYWGPKKSKPLDPTLIDGLLKEEWKDYRDRTLRSSIESTLAEQTTPLGVTSSFQHWDPYPLSIVSAKGAYVTDCDGRRLLDLSMGFGAILAGHLNPTVVSEVKSALDDHGLLFVTPSPVSRQAAEIICKRFNIDQVRFTNSGTEATMSAVRLARAISGKLGILKVEGGYHGGYDPLLVSYKPELKLAGPGYSPTAVANVKGLVSGDVFVTAYNDLACLEKVLKVHHQTIACFIIEPVLQNIGLIVPDAGYLEGVRLLCDRYQIILIFDEVKTGLTAGNRGSLRLGVVPDLICLAKSIGGGVAVGAFGGKKKFMDGVTNGTYAHCGTFNGNPLAAAGIRAMDIVCTPANLARAENLNYQALRRCQQIIQKYELPAQISGFGVKGCVTWSVDRVRNYRDYMNIDFKVSELHWLWMINRGIITPPGLDEQWLVSLAHGQEEIDRLVENFKDFAKSVTGRKRVLLVPPNDSRRGCPC